MSEKPLFSVILLHYNQPAYIKTAVDSVLSQTYENMEIVIMDDHSPAGGFNADALKTYIDENKGENIKNVKWQINEQNYGTVKGINLALKHCEGKYILFFAADDALYNEKVIENFADAFSDVPEDVYMLSSQCYMMDINLKKRLQKFIEPGEFSNFEMFDSETQFKKVSEKCCFAIGATAMKAEMFEKFGYFNENYKFIEDWSYMIHLTRNGGRIAYREFNGLLHRNGGVSHYKNIPSPKNLPPHVIAYKYDLIKIMENEIFPYIDKFSPFQQTAFLNLYQFYKNDYRLSCEGKKVLSSLSLLKIFKKIYIVNILRELVRLSEDNKKKYLRFIKAVANIWLCFSAAQILFAILGIIASPYNKPFLYFTVYVLPAIWTLSFVFYLISRCVPIAARLWTKFCMHFGKRR